MRNLPGQYEDKLFAPTLEDATRYGRGFYGFDRVPNTIMEVKVPNSVLKTATKFEADGMNAIFIPSDQLNLLKAKPLNFSPVVKPPFQ